MTHRRDGTPKATPVWAAEDAGELLVWTRIDSWKVKRLRHDNRVTVTPCNARGNTADNAVLLPGTARLMTEPEGLHRVRKAMTRTYGWQFRLLDSAGALLRLGKRPYIGIAITL